MASAPVLLDNTIPAECIDYFRQSVTETLATMCGEDEVRSLNGGDGSPCEAVIGIISLVGDMTWTLMIGLPSETASIISERFIGCEVPFDSPDMGDVVGELANIVAGDASCRLDSAGFRADLSLPTVARGKDVDVMLPAGVCRTQMCFSLNDKPFWVDLALAQGKP